MKRLFKKNKKSGKGMSSAVLLSVAIHAVLFLLAGMLVVFTVVKKEEKKFEPPQVVERPRMKLKKPKVKVKKTSKPKPTTRIVTKVNRASMPDIQIPEMSGMSEGFGGGLGGFELSLDLGEPTLFGGSQSIGNDFVGIFYDLKRNRTGGTISYSPEAFSDRVIKFIKSGWSSGQLARYYRSANELYATCFMVPPVFSLLAPEAFGEPDTVGALWLAHYKGELVCPVSHTNGITFRFRGVADNILVVRVDNEVVLSGCTAGGGLGEVINQAAWLGNLSADSRKYYMGSDLAVVGDWIRLEPGAPKKMEVLMGEIPGGAFFAMLAVEEQGVEYPKGPQGNPILPMFKTVEPPLDQIETIYADLIPGQLSVTNGPVFCDYDSASEGVSVKEEPIEPLVFADALENEVRMWTLVSGKTMNAELATMISGKAVLKDERGKMRKIPLDQLSEGDRIYIELAQPPKFDINFSKKSVQKTYVPSPYSDQVPPRHLDYTFSTRVKQASTGEYNRELKVEFFAIGREIDGDNYILLDRQESRFVPIKENGRSHEFSGKAVMVREKTINAGGSIANQRRGDKYGGYLVAITDERGYIIDAVSPYKWMPDIIGELRRLPVGKHFDKTGARVHPPRPKNYGQY